MHEAIECLKNYRGRIDADYKTLRKECGEKHPVGVMSFPVVNIVAPFDWLTNRKQAPYIPNSACLALFELPKPSTTATNYSGMLYATSTSS